MRIVNRRDGGRGSGWDKTGRAKRGVGGDRAVFVAGVGERYSLR